MCGETMAFPDTVEEFMERYKIVDTEQVYSNGAEYVPIFRMKQWFEHANEAEPKRGRWIKMSDADGTYWACSECGEDLPRISDFNPQFDLFPRLESIDKTNYCPNCGAKMEDEE